VKNMTLTLGVHRLDCFAGCAIELSARANIAFGTPSKAIGALWIAGN
jgi:hypothetical protein